MRHQNNTTKYEYQQERFGYNDSEDDGFFVIGDRVNVDGFRPASVAYFGETEFGQGDWVGVVLDDATGFHDGKLHGRSYFQCAPNHGLFVRPSRVARMSIQNQPSSSGSNRSTPLSRNSRCSMDSYFYDEDYRVPRVDARLLRPASTKNGNQGPKGILKYDPLERQSPSWIGDKTEELVERLARIQRAPARSPVYQFRPARVDLPQTRSSSLGRDKYLARELEIDREPIRGERVSFRCHGRDMEGTLRFVGPIECATGKWAGIELDEPCGNNDGSLLGRRYFVCPKNHGVFVLDAQIQRSPAPSSSTKALDLKSLRSTVISPPPPPLSAMRSTSTSPHSQVGSLKGGSSCSPFSPDLVDSPESMRRNYLTHTLHIRGPRPKFDESDIDRELKKSLQRQQYRPFVANKPAEPRLTRVTVGQNIDPVKPKAVQYTFTSTKHGGNPVAWRQVKYI